MQRAFQFPEVAFDCLLAHHAPTAFLLLYSLSRFPLYAANLCSLVGRDSDKYYRDSVTLLLAQGGPSRILTYSTSLSHFRCPFASFNGIISHRFSKRAFHWYSAPQCISHPCKTDVYFENVAISVQQRAFLTAKGSLGSAIQLHRDARGNQTLS
jgi:hypothetical protein